MMPNRPARRAPFPGKARIAARSLSHAIPALALLFAPAVRAQDLPAARATLAELVGINTVQKNGTRVAAQAVIRRLRAAGFPDSDIRLLAPDAAPDQANVVVRLRGKGAGKPVLFLAHLDVVEALPQDWTHDPFTLTEADGWYYGRGTMDIKGEVAAILTALIRLKQEGFVPERDIIVAFTADEEVTDYDGVDFLLKTHRGLIDAGLVLNADAGGGTIRDGRRLFYGFQTSEKIYAAFEVEATNPGGHSSVPRPDNAIYRLAHALERIEGLRFPVHLTDTTRAYFTRTAALEQGQTAIDMRAVARSADRQAADRLSMNPERNANLRTTCVATQLSGGHAENALPQRAKATVQCRVIPGERIEEVKAALAEAIGDPGIALTEIRPVVPSPESPPTPEVTALFTQTVQSMWPGLTVMPVMDTGGSDSVYTRAAGMPTYGAMSIFYDPDDIRAHGRDERISVRAFAEGVEFTYRLMKAAALMR
ncbi:M20/M25/M40 family metallo-hydrolase [Sphingomonas sp. LB-2]|uniref:M20/M25/M40 family metallo-hydrolase n=1 Tax=Sphingomonas caeni TaxID=2984949 RepID=UPI002230871C|nr:M20/M25/M40 family metallo-hydrolase [Sphingomonas caeni]MCW3849106.1 M20/M25/M40 family metallo-hydrolase [Sphingomonas caeni]